MTTDSIATTPSPVELDPTVFARVLDEGYGPGAWHGADLRAALADVSPQAAFWRPAPDRHNVAEVALHHAWVVRSVIARLSGRESGPFPLQGDDWFVLSIDGPLSWPDVLSVVDEHQRELADVVAQDGVGEIASSLSAKERFDLVLGVTCHAIYHAGQVQLLKVLRGG